MICNFLVKIKLLFTTQCARDRYAMIILQRMITQDRRQSFISFRTSEVLASSKVPDDQSSHIPLHSLQNTDLFHKGPAMSRSYLTATAILPMGLIGSGLAPGNIPLLRTRAPFCITPGGTKKKKSQEKKKNNFSFKGKVRKTFRSKMWNLIFH